MVWATGCTFSHSDVDGNGRLEPWEYTNVTKIVVASGKSITFTNDDQSAVIDGFTIKNNLVVNNTATYST